MTVGGSSAWEGAVYHLCDYGGLSGLSVAEWQMNITYSVEMEGAPFSPGTVLMQLSTPRQYINMDKFDTGSSWSFNYSLNYTDTSGSGMSVSIPVSGTFKDEGTQIVSVMGDSMEAWHISSTYTMLLTAAGGFTRDYPGEADYYWVEGLGLVAEEHVDTETGATILAKELSAVSGL
jgi:hypothetical protein